MLRLLGLVLCLVVRGALSAQYGLVKDYSGAQFFEGWDFYDHCCVVFSFLFFLLQG